MNRIESNSSVRPANREGPTLASHRDSARRPREEVKERPGIDRRLLEARDRVGAPWSGTTHQEAAARASLVRRLCRLPSGSVLRVGP